MNVQIKEGGVSSNRSDEQTQVNPKVVNKLTNLSTKALKAESDEKKNSNLKKLRTIVEKEHFDEKKISQILIDNGFEVKKVKNLISQIFNYNNNWGHGDALTKKEAEKILENTPTSTWLLRHSEKLNCYIVSIKTDDGFEHKLDDIDTSKKGLLGGLSKQYSLENMILNDSVFEDSVLFLGELSTNRAHELLKDARHATWLLRKDPVTGDYIMTIKQRLGAIKDCKIPRFFQDADIHNYQQLFTFASAASHQDVTPQTNLYLVKPSLRSLEQTQIIVDHLFKNISSRVRHEYEANQFVKLSRRKYPLLTQSMMIVKSDGENSYKIFKTIHGLAGRLGSGGYKDVKCLENLADPYERLARAKFRDLTPDDIRRKFPEMSVILKEVRGMSYIAAGHLIRTKTHDDVYISVVMLPFAGHSLNQMIKANSLTASSQTRFGLHLLKALVSLHEKKIAHRDIKPDNILIITNTKTDRDQACLSDFDAATKVDSITRLGTPAYMDPIINNGKGKNTIEELMQSDVYSMGMTIYELFTGHHMWLKETFDKQKAESAYEAYKKLYKNYPNMTAKQRARSFPEPEADSFVSLIWLMVHPDPQKRPTAAEALVKYEKLIY